MACRKLDYACRECCLWFAVPQVKWASDALSLRAGLVDVSLAHQQLSVGKPPDNDVLVPFVYAMKNAHCDRRPWI